MRERIQLNLRLSIICLIGGILLTILPLIEFDMESPSHIIAVFLGITLVGSGLNGLNYCRIYKNKMLSFEQDSTIDKWVYIPQQFSEISQYVMVQKLNYVVTNILIVIMFLILGVGFVFSGASNSVGICYVTCSLAVVGGLVNHLLITKYYNNLATQNVEVIFSSKLIYFLGNYYDSYYSLYRLKDIYISDATSHPTLNFVYGSIGDVSSGFSLTLPIPPDTFFEALNLCDYYTNSLSPIQLYD
ncbi:MAG: hypothetical protein ATN35_05665 [Epulopiscium sp. Nele67-Bin004]|nr:MAG: hypothetical protein ATN35_05665 [Epulopiscium sp. Nele67-Bin004]